jgi:hypothetical protein
VTPALNQVVGHVNACGIHEAADYVVCPVEFGNRFEPVLVQEALHQGAIHLRANPAVGAVDDIVNLSATWQGDVQEITEHIVLIGGDEGAGGLRGKLAVAGIGIGRALVLE